jgi:hypothetical protein
VSKTISAIIAAALLAPVAALADAAPAAAPAAEPAKPPPPKWYDVVEVHGVADGYYQLRLDASQDAQPRIRVFDPTNGFNVGMAELAFNVNPAPAGLHVDVFYNGSGGPAGANAFGIRQAYASFKLGDKVVLDVGRYGTPFGVEVTQAEYDFMYSRSNLFFLQPGTHTGARATITLTDQLSAQLFVCNGWDVIATSGAGRTGMASLSYAGPNGLGLIATLGVGANPTLWTNDPVTNLPAVNTDDKVRTFLDLIGTGNLGPLALQANFDWGSENSKSYWGASLQGRYALPGDVAKIAARGEYIMDTDGARYGLGVETKVFSATANVAFPVGASSELRVEGRYDHSDPAQYAKDAAGTATDGQFTATVAGLAWF